ncbi:MAG: hypothetical protein NWR39_03000, partial [Pseudomonadota bacterium]|nr:hypothetical protein [Pseudomonadota bacterium]
NKKLAAMNPDTRPQRAAQKYPVEVFGSVAKRLQGKYSEWEVAEKGGLQAVKQKTTVESQQRQDSVAAEVEGHAARLAAESRKHTDKLKGKIQQKNDALVVAQEELEAAQEELVAARSNLADVQGSLEDTQESLLKIETAKSVSDAKLVELDQKLKEAQAEGDKVAEAMFEELIANESKLKEEHDQDRVFLVNKIREQNIEIARLKEVEKSREDMLKMDFPKTPAPKARAKKSSVDTEAEETKFADVVSGDLFGFSSADLAEVPVAASGVPSVDSRAGGAKPSGRRARPDVLHSASQAGVVKEGKK